MPAARRRPDSEFQATVAQMGQQIVTLASLTGGLNDYTSPELMSPQFWAACSNVYSGQFGTIRRARWAPFLNSSTTGYTPTAVRMTSMFGVYYPLQDPWLFFDTDGEIWWDDIATHVATVNTQSGTFFSYFYLPAWNLTGPFMRIGMGGALLFQTNGLARSKIFTDPSLNVPTLSLDGIDAPDSSPQVTLIPEGSFTPTAMSRTSNVVTITGTVPSSFAVGSGITVTGSSDPSFNSPVGTCFILTFKSATTLQYAQIGPNSTGSVPVVLVLTSSHTHGVYNGTITGGASNAFVGQYVTIAGFSDAANNGTFLCTFSSATNFLTNNSTSTNEVHAGTATFHNAISGALVENGLQKTVGRSYQYAWENANTGHVSAPSPASIYVPLPSTNPVYTTVSANEPGTATIANGSSTVTGTNSFFSQAWIGRRFAAVNATWTAGVDPFIVSVASATSMTLSDTLSSSTVTNGNFFIYDGQITHIRFYATGDGQATYLRIARNSVTIPFTGGGTQLQTDNCSFIDQFQAEPPNAPFTNELTQTQNVPPPIATYQQDYQGRRLLYGVPGSPQSFFYSNIEATVVGQPPESFAPLNVVTLPIGDGALFGSANLPTGCMIWSNRQEMFKLTGTLTDNTIANSQQLGSSIQRLPYKIGCASPYATTVTSLGCLWLSSDREVWLFTDHYAPKNVGKPIQTLLSSATRINFARMKTYKSGDRNWLALAITTQGNTFNDTLCLLDLDLLASNGQPSFFTFDMATNQPSWYIFNVNCEALESAFDANSISHLLAGDVDLITDVDWQPAYYTVGTEQTVPAPSVTLHAVGNEAPEMIKTGKWMRSNTNQLPKYLASQGWNFVILAYDDDKYVLGQTAQMTKLIPGTNSPSQVFGLESSPALFKFGSSTFIKGRRFQIQANFPSSPGFYELRSFQFCFDQIVAR